MPAYSPEIITLGILECWNNGILGIKTDIILIIISDFEFVSKKDIILWNP
jgi:hypothetical protein